MRRSLFQIFCTVCIFITSSTIVLGGAKKLDKVESQLEYGHGQYIEKKSKNYVMRCMLGPDKSASIGSYSIYIYNDPSGYPIARLAKERDGTINDCWFTNIDGDKNPEVLIFSTSAGSGSYGKLDVFEFNGTDLKQIELPNPAKKLMEGYMGHDRYEVVGGKIFRTFPIYLEGGSNSSPRGGTRTLEYYNPGDSWKLSSKKNAGNPPRR